MKKAIVSKNDLIYLLIILVSIGVIIFVFLNPSSIPRTRIAQSIYDAFSGICAGEAEEAAVEEASLFAGGPSSPVPTLLLNSDGSAYGSSKGFGKGWIPNSVSEVQLVVCVGKETGLARGCGGVLYSNVNGRKVYVREAKTGANVYEFTIWGRYWCEGEPTHQDEYSVSAIKAILEAALSSGKIAIPSTRIFHSVDILRNPQGKSTYIHITAHRFQTGDRLSLVASGCTYAEMGAMATSQYYHVDWVNEDTVQLLSMEQGTPIELTDFNVNCTGVLTKE